MVNKILFRSSIINALFCLYFLKQAKKINTLNLYMILLGSCTSIWNHSTTSILAQTIDRTVMRIGVFVDIYLILFISDYSIQLLCFYLLSGAIGLYLISKLVIYISCETTELSNFFHVMSHIYITLVHAMIIIKNQ